MNSKKIFIIVALVSVCHFACAQKAPAFWPDIVAFKKLDSAKFPPKQAILFIGSSSFAKWKDVSDYFPGYTIINRGFGGSTLLDVIRYTYDIAIPYEPKQVVIYCGENDLAYVDTLSAATVVNRFKTFYAMLRQNLPNATIDFVAIKPSPSRKNILAKTVEANKNIQAFLKKQKNAAFINIVPIMLDASGNVKTEIFLPDMLHLKPEGYKLWQTVIEPYLKK